jgi:hypothetical protein
MGGLEDVKDACNEKHRWLSSIAWLQWSRILCRRLAGTRFIWLFEKIGLAYFKHHDSNPHPITRYVDREKNTLLQLSFKFGVKEES